MRRLICGHQFILVTALEPERDLDGRVREFNPLGPNGRALSDAPFCRFRFPADRPESGVYAVTVTGRVVYVGKTSNLSRRFGPGQYGEIIVPAVPSEQTTNRRVNHGILEAVWAGHDTQVWFHRTGDHIVDQRCGDLVLRPFDYEGLRNHQEDGHGQHPDKPKRRLLKRGAHWYQASCVVTGLMRSLL